MCIRDRNTYARLVNQLKEQLDHPEFSHQIGLTLLIYKEGIRHEALSLEYNFPNDDKAMATRTHDKNNIKFCYYLRDDNHDYKSTLLTQERFYDYLFADFRRSDAIIQNSMKSVSGGLWPF